MSLTTTSAEITLLGDVGARPGGQGSDAAVAPAGTPQMCVALAALVLERHHDVTRDALAEAIWPGELPATWRPALRGLVSQVRAFLARTLGQPDHELLVAAGGTYRLRLPDDTAVDVEVAESQVQGARDALARRDHRRARHLADAAAARLQAPFLPGHDSDWVGTRRAHLDELLVVALEVASQAARSQGDVHAAQVAASEAVRRAPLRESAHRYLMAAHDAAGNRAEALRSYQGLRRLLAVEMGVDPDEETEAAYLRLLRPAPREAGGDAGPANPAPADPGVVGEPASFVGRGAEMAVATAAWSRARAGAAQMLLVTGEPGAGKTRLATELIGEVARDGGLVMSAQSDRQGLDAYQPVVDLLDALVATTPAEDLRQWSPRARAELARVFPSFPPLPSSPSRSVDPLGPTDAPNRRVLHHAVAKLVDSIAKDHPLLVVLDDLQWWDQASTTLVGHVLRRSLEARILVVALTRGPLGRENLLDDTVRTFDDRSRLVRLELGGLDPRAGHTLVDELLARRSGDPSPAPNLVADAAGNPGLLVEAARAHAAGASAGTSLSHPSWGRLQAAVTVRLGALGPLARRLLEAAATSALGCELDVAAEVLDLGEAEVVDALDEAIAAGLLTEVAATEAGDRLRFGFRQELVRRAFYDRLSQARRRHLHERLADTVEGRGHQTTPDDVVALAHHRSAAAADGRGDSRALQGALAAAQVTARRGEPTEAVAWCRRALDHVAPGDLASEAEVLAELGRAQAAVDDPDGAHTLLTAAVRARRAGRPEVATQAALDLTELARREPDRRRTAAAVVDDLLTGGRPALGDRAWPGPDRTGWARLVARHVELAGPDGISATEVATATSLLARHMGTHHGPDGLDRRQGWAEDLLTVAEAAGDHESTALAHHHRAMAAAIACRHDEAGQAVTAMARALRAADGGAAELLLLEEHRAAVAVRHGRQTGLAQPPLAPAPTRGWGQIVPGIMLAHQHVVAAWLGGRLERRHADVAPDEGIAPAVVAGERALVDLATGGAGHAHVALRDLADEVREAARQDEWLHTMGLLAIGAVELRDRALAGDVYEVLLPYEHLSAGAGYRSFTGTVAFHLGRLAAVTRRGGEAERHLTHARQQLTALRARPWARLTERALAAVGGEAVG